MKTIHEEKNCLRVPKRRQQHHSYDESVDESAKLMEDEAVEIEQEAPSEENEPTQRVDDTPPPPPAFED